MPTTTYWFDFSRFKSGQDHQFNLLWLLIFAIALIFTGIGLREPWPADEPRFAQIAKEMVETGQWFFPMRGGELYPDKPPIFMWSIACFYWLFGSIKVAFLLPSALCATLTTFLVYDLGRRFWSPQVGWRAAILLLLTLQFTLQAKTAQIDAMVCCWITLGCYGLLRHFLSKDNWRWYFIGCFFMGIGVITKGVGFLPILMLIPYFILRKLKPQRDEIEGSWRWAVGIVVLLGAIMLWFIPMLMWVEHSQNPLFEQYRDNILFKQTATRYANAWHHIKPFWYYLLSVIPVFWLPISLMLPWLVKHWAAAFRQNDRRIMLPLCWIVLVLLFFSFSPGKRGVYILPALPMLALISAPYLKQILQHIRFNLLLAGVVILLSSLFLLLGIAGLLELKFTVKLVQQYQLSPWWFLLTLGGLGWLALAMCWRKALFVSWILFIPCLWLLYSTWGYQLLAPVKTPKNVLTNIQALIPAQSELGMVGLKEQFLLFSPFNTTHFGYHTVKQQQFAKAWQWHGEQPNRYLLASKQAKPICYDASQAISVGRAHNEDWVLFKVSARLSTCVAPDPQVQAFQYYNAVLQ